MIWYKLNLWKQAGLAAAMFWGITIMAAPELDPGGISMDLTGKQIKKAKTIGENLIPPGQFREGQITLKSHPGGGWRGISYCAKSDFKKINDFTSRAYVKKTPPEKGFYIALNTSTELLKLNPELKNVRIKNTLFQDIPLQGSTTYQLSFDYRGKAEGGIYNGLTVYGPVVNTSKYISLKYRTGKTLQKSLTLKQDWTNYSINFTTVADAELIRLCFILEAFGSCDIDNIELREVQKVGGLDMLLTPIMYVDNTFYLASGQPGIMFINALDWSGKKPQAPFAHLKLPPGFEVVGVQDPIKMLPPKVNPDKSSVYTFDLAAVRSKCKAGYNLTFAIAPLIVPSVPPGEKKYTAEYYISNGDYTSKPRKFSIEVMEPIHGKKPKRFQIGGVSRHGLKYSGRSAHKVAEFYRQCGFNAAMFNRFFSTDMAKEFKKAGISRYLQPPKGIYNGNVLIGMPAKPGPDAAFITQGNKPLYSKYGLPLICPYQVYTRGKYYREYVVGAMEQYIRDGLTDSFMVNWEPDVNFKGCFCTRCRDAFIAYSGIAKDEIIKGWPQSTLQKYQSQWVKFRSWQHGKLLETLQQDTAAVGKKYHQHSNFIPELSIRLALASRRLSPQHAIIDYMDKLPWLNLWGPYLYHDLKHPYEYISGMHLVSFFAAKEAKQYINENIQNPKKRPRLISFPHSNCMFDWVSEPKALSFDSLCFLAAGWEGVFAYYLPQGCDLRYYREMSKVAAVAAEFEDFVFDGKELPAPDLTPLTPLPKFAGGLIPRWQEAIPSLQNDPSLLQASARQLGDKRMLAVGNFWQKGEVFYKLKIPGLETDKKYSLSLPVSKLRFAGSDGKNFSGKELAAGILLQTGALRWNFYLLEPAGENESKGFITLTQNAVNRIYQERKVSIQAAFDNEKKQYSKQRREIGIPDYSSLKAMNNAGVACAPVKTASGTMLAFSTQNAKILIDIARGGQVTSWKVDGVELVTQEKEYGLGIDAFFGIKERTILTRPYRLVSQKKTGNGLSLNLERRLVNADNPIYAGLTVRKEFRISPDTMKIISTVSNTGMGVAGFLFRWHNMLAPLQQNGTAEMVGSGIKYQRCFMRKLYLLAARPDEKILDVIRSGKKRVVPEKIKSSEVVFALPSSDSKVILNVEPSAELNCFVIWDDGGWPPTFEPIFNKVALAEGQSWSASMTFTWNKKENEK
ncbi:MAG: hypothetical protein PHV59_03270 [Victivallales bacterium]|nr:hypothetical protein [Victivallales bacterium]